MTPVIIVVVAVGGFALWNWQAERKFSRFLDGLRQKGEPITWREAVGPPVAEADNGAFDIRAAGEAVDSEGAGEFFNMVGLSLPLSEQELEVARAALAANETTLAKFRDSQGKPAIEWTGIPPSQSRSSAPQWWGGRGSGFYRHRSVAHLLYASSLVAVTDGNDLAAFDRIEDLFYFADAMGRRVSLWGQGSSHKLHEFACVVLGELLPDLKIGDGPGQVPPARVKALIARLSNEDVPRQSILRCLRAERGRYIDVLAAGSGPVDLPPSDSGRGDPLPLPWTPSSSALGAILSHPVNLAKAEEALERLSVGMDSFSASTLSEYLFAFPIDPFPVARAIRTGEQQGEGDPARMLTASMHAIARGYYAALARRRTAAAALAIKLYQHEKGKWPAKSLTELVPEYLPSLPEDPLSGAGNPIAFVPEAGRPRVYSVGEDGIDDGGWPLDPRANLREDSRVTDWVIDLVRQPRRPAGQPS